VTDGQGVPEKETAVSTMSVMSVANQHNVFSSYGAVHMQRQLIPSAALHSQELNRAAQQAAAQQAVKDEQRAEKSVVAADTENRAHRYDRRSPQNNGSEATGASTTDVATTGPAPRPAEVETAEPAAPRDPEQLGVLLDIYL